MAKIQKPLLAGNFDPQHKATLSLLGEILLLLSTLYFLPFYPPILAGCMIFLIVFGAFPSIWSKLYRLFGVKD